MTTYRVFMFNDCDMQKSESCEDLADAIIQCENDKSCDRYEIHQAGSERDWDHYMFGERKPSGHIDWKKVPWRRM